jgi:hypothetical protein
MKRSFLSFAFVACLFSLPASADEPSKQDGFTSLFDGKTLTGWRNAYDWGKIDRPLPTPPAHDPRPLLQRRSPKKSKFL